MDKERGFVGATPPVGKAQRKWTGGFPVRGSLSRLLKPRQNPFYRAGLRGCVQAKLPDGNFSFFGVSVPCRYRFGVMIYETYRVVDTRERRIRLVFEVQQGARVSGFHVASALKQWGFGSSLNSVLEGATILPPGEVAELAFVRLTLGAQRIKVWCLPDVEGADAGTRSDLRG